MAVLACRLQPEPHVLCVALCDWEELRCDARPKQADYWGGFRFEEGNGSRCRDGCCMFIEVDNEVCHKLQLRGAERFDTEGLNGKLIPWLHCTLAVLCKPESCWFCIAQAC